MLAPQNRSEKKYTGWVVSIIFGHNGAPATYRIRFSKQKEADFLLQETFAEAVIEAHPEPGLAPCFVLSYFYAALLTLPPTAVPFWIKDLARKRDGSGNRQNMRQGESAGSSSRAGGSAGPSSAEGASRPRKSAPTTPPLGERKNPLREKDCINPTCKAACEGSVVGTPCGPPLPRNCSLR